MREYWTVAIYRRTEKGFGVAVFDWNRHGQE